MRLGEKPAPRFRVKLPYLLFNLYLYGMLKELRIRNYAIINEASISFSGGMNIITGETGAGKSILLGALSLILGERAESKVLFSKDKKCVVEGVFDISNYQLADFFASNEIDFENETIIRRELTESGKSRAFINDTPVNLNLIQQLASRLITIHSQHETLDLGNSGFQLTVVDALASTGQLVATFKTHYHAWKTCAKKLAETEALAAKALTEKDFVEFQFTELDNASLDGIDQIQLETELTQLSHAEEIKRNLILSVDVLENGQGNINDQLRAVINQLNAISKYQPELADYIQRLESTNIELKDITRDLDDKASATVADPARSENIQTQLNSIYRLQKKHGCNTLPELISLRDSLGEKLLAYVNSEATIETLKKERDALFVKVSLAAKKLSEKRAGAFEQLEKSVHHLLSEVGMKDAVLKVEHQFSTDKYLTETGADHIQFMFSANKGSSLQDIKKVASGGELSRLMLCIKSLLAKSVALPTLIFDEIDTGVSGEIAHKVGNILMRLSENHQLIAITHLPQIAAKGQHHLFVYKSTDAASTSTNIKLLNKTERLNEIAKMLSGENPTKAAIQNAKELLLQA